MGQSCRFGATGCMSVTASIAAATTDIGLVGDVPILLQKSLVISANSDSVALARFAAEAVDDGAAQSRSRAIFLFIPP
jgi:hypothetical protein